MLRGLTLPATWRGLLEALRPACRRGSTFAMFTLLASGLVAQTARRTVVGMLAATGMAAIVSRLLAERAAIEVVIDDTLFRRWGRKVHAVFWTHDGAAQDPNALGRGNRWVVLSIVVELPFCCHPVSLPVLLRLWAGKGTASPVQLAGELIMLLAKEFPDRSMHAVGDAAYHGKPLLVAGATITTRLPANAALYAPAPPRTGKRGRPRRKGDRLGTPAQIAATAQWHTTTVSRYGEQAAPRSTASGTARLALGRIVLVRDPGEQKILALFTTDRDSTVETIVARYAHRWTIETAIAAGKQLLGIGQARNRLQRAVERTVPFGFVVYSLVIVWYALHGHHPDDLHARRRAQPWYRHKDQPAFEDMLAKLRRTLVAAQITGVAAAQPDPDKYRDYELACAAAAA